MFFHVQQQTAGGSARTISAKNRKIQTPLLQQQEEMLSADSALVQKAKAPLHKYTDISWLLITTSPTAFPASD